MFKRRWMALGAAFGVQGAVALLLLSLLVPMKASAESTSVRFYTLHKRDGEKRIRAKNTDEPGCHNFRGHKKLHRVGLVGFGWCTVYSEKNCAEGSEIPAMWTGKRYRTADIDVKAPQIRLLRGSKWEFTDKKTVLDNDARRYQEESRKQNRKARQEALAVARKEVELAEQAGTASSFFANKEASKKEKKKPSIAKHRFGKKSKNVFADDNEPEPLSPQEKLEQLEKLEKEIGELEEGYIEGLQRNVAAASWYCEAQ